MGVKPTFCFCSMIWSNSVGKLSIVMSSVEIGIRTSAHPGGTPRTLAYSCAKEYITFRQRVQNNYKWALTCPSALYALTLHALCLRETSWKASELPKNRGQRRRKKWADPNKALERSNDRKARILAKLANILTNKGYDIRTRNRCIGDAVSLADAALLSQARWGKRWWATKKLV